MKPIFKNLLFALTISCLLFSCSKNDPTSAVKDYTKADMTIEVSYKGDLSSQLVFATVAGFSVKNANDNAGASIKLIKDQTKESDII